MILCSVNFAVLGALFNIGAAPRPSNIGVTSGKQLNLCPSTPNISTGAPLEPLFYCVHHAGSQRSHVGPGRAMIHGQLR